MLVVKDYNVYAMLINYRADLEQIVYGKYWSYGLNNDNSLDYEKLELLQENVIEINYFLMIWRKEILKDKSIYEGYEMKHDLIFKKTLILLEKRVRELNEILHIHRNSLNHSYERLKNFLMDEQKRLKEFL